MLRTYLITFFLFFSTSFCFASAAELGDFPSGRRFSFREHRAHWAKQRRQEGWIQTWGGVSKKERWLNHLASSHKKNRTFRESFSQSPFLWLQVSEDIHTLSKLHHKKVEAQVRRHLQDKSQLLSHPLLQVGSREILSNYLATYEDFAVLYLASCCYIKMHSLPQQSGPKEWGDSDYPPSPHRLESIYNSRSEIKTWDEHSKARYMDIFTIFCQLVDRLSEDNTAAVSEDNAATEEETSEKTYSPIRKTKSPFSNIENGAISPEAKKKRVSR